MNWEAEAADITGLSRDFLKRDREGNGGLDGIPVPRPLRSIGWEETSGVVEGRLGGSEVREGSVTPPAGMSSLLQEQLPDILLTVEVD